MRVCPCGSGKELDQCCGRYLKGEAVPTAEALMRARYTAYVVEDFDFVENTCAPEIRKEFDRKEAEDTAKGTEWLGLDVSKVEAGGEKDETGTVDFTFHFKYSGQTYSQREIASFRRDNGAWIYVDSTVNPKGAPAKAEHVGRNDPCPCGSGKKYKKCCGVAA